MKRRSFLAGLGAALAGLAGLAGLCGWKTAAAASATLGTIPPTERDRHGICLARIYRRDAVSGSYHEIGRDAAKPGDRCIVIGLDGSRLWRADAFTIGKQGAFIDPADGGPTVCIEGEVHDLFRAKQEGK